MTREAIVEQILHGGGPVRITYDLDMTSMPFNGYRLSHREVARQAIRMIARTLAEIIDFEQIDEASLIVDARIRKSSFGELMPAQLVLRAAFDNNIKRDNDITKWGTMQRAARSIDELLSWPKSAYSLAADAVNPISDESGTIKPASHHWRENDLSVMQIATGFGCIILSFQIKLVEDTEEGINSRSEKIAQAMMHATATILCHIMQAKGDTMAMIGNTSIISCDPLDSGARNLAKLQVEEWLARQE